MRSAPSTPKPGSSVVASLISEDELADGDAVAVGVVEEDDRG